MLKKRKDGDLVKLDPLFKITPLIMKERNDAQVWLTEDVPTAAIDDYIKKKMREGVNLSYMHIFYCALLRTIKLYPQINQFVMKGRVYRRKAITVALAVKKDMTIEGQETVVKLDFKGTETPEDVKNILNASIEKEKTQDDVEDNDMENVLKVFDKLPHWLLRWVVNFFMFLDKNNFMPNSIIKASPFHSTAFVNNLGSLGIDAINHHIYNFGTIGIFLSIGKRGRRLALKRGELVEEKTISLGLVADERICDGFYFAKALKQMFKFLKKPDLLDEVIDENEVYK